MAMACVTVAVPNPRNFVYLAVASSSQVMLATLVYIAHIVASRRRTLAAQLPEPAS